MGVFRHRHRRIDAQTRAQSEPKPESGRDTDIHEPDRYRAYKIISAGGPVKISRHRHSQGQNREKDIQ